MNYLDAWSIVNEYIDFFAQDNNNTGNLIYSWEVFSFGKGLNKEEWKEKLIAASCIYWSYAIFWNTKDGKQLEKYHALLKQGKSFVSDQNAKIAADAWDIITKSTNSRIYKFFNKRKVALAGQIYSSHSPNLTMPFDENGTFVHAVNHMIEYKQKLKNFFENDVSKICSYATIADYCRETYHFLNIPEPENAWFYFLTFKEMKLHLEDPKFRHHYAKYETILCNYQQ